MYGLDHMGALKVAASFALAGILNILGDKLEDNDEVLLGSVESLIDLFVFSNAIDRLEVRVDTQIEDLAQQFEQLGVVFVQ